jgi:glucose/arabinose dehydrogenase
MYKKISVVFIVFLSLSGLLFSSALMTEWGLYPFDQPFKKTALSLKRIGRSSITTFENKGILKALGHMLSGVWETADTKNKTIVGAQHIITAQFKDMSSVLNTYTETVAAPGHIADLDRDNLMIVSATGDVFKLLKNSSQLIPLVSNLKKRIDDQEPHLVNSYSGDDISERLTVRDVAYNKKSQTVYVSYFKYNKSHDCFAVAIDKAKFNANSKSELNFVNFFTPNFCRKSNAAAGRIDFLEKNVIFTIGTYDSNSVSHSKNWDLHIGALLKISPKGEAKTLAKGLKNSLGLVVALGEIFISDNGPMGGDLFTIVKKGDHFGWPTHSYGFSYSKKDEYERPMSPNFSEPSFYFTPSLGTSQLMFYNKSYFSRFENKFLLTSMKTGSLYVIDYDIKTNRVKSYETFKVGERIRDAVVGEEGFIWLLSDSANIIRLTRANFDMKDKTNKGTESPATLRSWIK